jgi:hypothetical protein
VLLMLGLTQARARSMSMRRLFILPIVMTVMSTWGDVDMGNGF